ncbi:MAG: hypothetical protein ACFFDV_09990 [Candidatus Thorarchaeota archaeon]
MGDVLITYDEYGQKYLRRVVYLNVLLYIMMGILFLLFTVDILILILTAIIAVMVSFVYVLYFIHRHPPAEYDEGYMAEL